MKKIANKVIRKLGRENYSLDKSLSVKDLIRTVLAKLVPLVRGIFYKAFFKKSKGVIFIGRNTRIKFKNKIILGRTVQIGNNVEINALSKDGIRIGDNVSIHRNSIIECTGVIRDLGEGLSIGNNVGIAQNCFIQVRGRVTIGNNVIFGPGVSIFSENHNFGNPDIPISLQGETRKGVVIEDGVWIASGVTILDGVTIGSNSIVAAGSVVTKDVSPFSIVGGIPATIMKYRNKV